MEWRPKNWENPFILYEPAVKIEVDLGHGKEKYGILTNEMSEENAAHSAYESGADAILKALKERGHHVDKDAAFCSLVERTTLKNKNCSGTYVFIPD